MTDPFHAGDSEPDAMEACYAAQRIAFGPVVFQACRALRDLGVLRELHRHPEGVTLATLQSRTDLSRYALKLLLESGMSADVVRLEEEHWHLTKTGWFLLEDELTNINMDFVHHVNYQALFHLDQSIREERPVGLQAFGDWPVIYPGLASLPGPVRDSWFRFDHYYSDAAIEQARDTILALRPCSILEIGGNTGSFSIALASAIDDATITLLDLPEQIALASQRFAEHGLEDRIATVAADMLDGHPLDGEYELIWMSQFLDCFSQEDTVHVLRKARGALADHGSILIMEPLWDRQRFAVSAYCIINTSPYFTVMANGCSKMSNLADLEQCITEAGLKLAGTYDGLGVCQTILRCTPA